MQFGLRTIAMICSIASFAVAQTTVPSTQQTSNWIPLFNGHDLAGFHTFIKTPGLDKDPEGYFKVETVDGQPALHVMDLPLIKDKRDFGYFITDNQYGNCEIQFQYKWGEKKHAPRTKTPRDAGCLYLVVGDGKVWPDSVECQVEEHDTGDLWIVGHNIEVTTTAQSPRGNARGELAFDPHGPEVHFRNGVPLTAENSAADLTPPPPSTQPAKPKLTNGRVIKGETADSLTGWNTVQIFIRGNESVHVVNGRIVNHFTNMHLIDSGKPLDKGRILFQAEGAEVFYRDMKVRPLAADEQLPITQSAYDATWKVNDRTRPLPARMEPKSEAELAAAAKPPANALILFDGDNLSAWRDPHWKIENGYVEIVPFPKGQKKAGGNALTSTLTPDQLADNWQLVSKDSFGNCKIHMEFNFPMPSKGKDQAKGNSGVYLMGKYEMQVLDNTDNPTYADGLAGAVYGENPPLWEASRPSGEWNYYDIDWTAPVFNPDGSLAKSAKVSAWLNGIQVQRDFELPGPTEHEKRLPYLVHDAKLPLMLQNHGQIVRYRNIWLQPTD